MPFKISPPLYSIWKSMKRRCYAPNSKQFKDYGGRGIKICPEWLNNYKQFAKDMGDRPLDMTIERKNNDGDYTPNNCKWATRAEQQRNRRIKIMVTIEGIEYWVRDLAKMAGIKGDTIVHRAELGYSFKEVTQKTKLPDSPSVKAHKKIVAQRNGKKRAEKLHCKQGHAFTNANTYWTTKNTRVCRICDAIRDGRKIKPEWQA